MRTSRSLALLGLTLLGMAGCGTPPSTGSDAAQISSADQDMDDDGRREVIAPEGVPGLAFFSPGILTDDLIFLSGAIGAKPGTLELVEGGVGPETTMALENLRTVLRAAGADMEDVVKCTVFISDIADFGTMNEAYAAFFPEDPPARSTVAVSGLALGAHTEIECIAVAPDD